VPRLLSAMGLMMDTALLDDAVGDGGRAGGDPTGTDDDSSPASSGKDGSGSGTGSDQGDAARRPVHRLRDLDRRGRVIAALLAAALTLAPLLAFAWAAPDWTPANDPALMALRSLDVGGSRTPLTGQPSTSAHYTSDQAVVDHPGPIHFYVMAPTIRLLGAGLGMLAVSFAIVTGCLLIAAWALFRQLGPAGGVVSTVVLGAITFTTGAATLVNPVSSNIARYPLLCSMVLVWCLLCGDTRLLPLASAVLSFTAKQHLSVLPTVGVVAAIGTVSFLVAWGGQGRWRERGARRRLAGWGGAAVAVALVLWTPVLYQQFFGDGPGNLTQMASFAQHDERPSIGMGSAVRQAAHVLGLPPLLGQLELEGEWLLAPVKPVTWATAGLVVAIVAGLGFHWRRSRPRQAALVVAAGIVLLAGIMNGSSVPEGLEKFRLSLYHWAWPLILFVTVSLALGVIELLRRLPVTERPWVPTAACGLAVVAIVVPSAVNPRLDRQSNELMEAYSPISRPLMDDLVGQVLDHEDDMPAGPIVLLERGQRSDFRGLREALAVGLEEKGLETVHPAYMWTGVDADRLAQRDTVQGGLVVVADQVVGVDEAVANEIPGEPIAEIDQFADFDHEAFATLADQITQAGRVQMSAEGERALAELPEAKGEVLAAVIGFLPLEPGDGLSNPLVLRLLRDHPPTSPRLDPDALDRVIDTLPEAGDVRLRVYLLDRDELLAYALPGEISG
jgi:hypothetical protein